MTEQQLAAVKQALGALKKGTGWMEHGEIIAALQSIISQDALHKMAEESRTSGLRLDDWPKIGCVNHDCDKCKAVQEPVGVYGHCPICGAKGVTRERRPDGDDRCANGHTYKSMHATTPPAPQPVPVKTYHDGKPWPVAPKPWVGLTDEERNKIRFNYLDYDERAQAIEAKLKEKNHG